MQQSTRGLHRLLNLGTLYDLVQRVVGDENARTRLQREFIQSTNDDVVLDIGCGTGTMARFLAYREYVGFDIDAGYIARARKFEYPNASFIAADSVSVGRQLEKKEFEVVIAIGVLHHIDDQVAGEVLTLARELMQPNGRLITVDPCIDSESRWLARKAVKADRGKAIRTSCELNDLISPMFSRVQITICRDLLRIPYSHAITVSSK